MPLSTNEKDLEQQLRSLPMKNLTPTQMHADREAILQALSMRARQKRQQRRMALVALCAAMVVALGFGVVKNAPKIEHMGVSLFEKGHHLPPELQPVQPESISRDAVLIYQNGVSLHGFLTYGNYYYVATNQLVKRESELGNELGKILKGSGPDDTTPVENLESYYFPPGGAIYSLAGIDPNERIAYQYYTNGNKGSAYLIFQRATPLGQRPLDTYTGAKGSTDTIAETLANIRQSFPHFYELDGHQSQLKQVVYQPMNGPGAFLSYVYQNQDLDIYEYQKGMEDSKDANLPDAAIYRGATTTAQRTFTENDIHWSMFADDLYRGEMGNYYYVVRPHGQSFTVMRGLLQEFKPH